MPRITITYISRENCFKFRWKEKGKTRERKSAATNRRQAIREAAKLEKELETVNETESWQLVKRRYGAEHCGPAAKVSWQSACKWVEKAGEIQSPEDITTSLLSQAVAIMEASGLARATVRGYLRHFMAGLRWAKDLGLMQEVPKVRLPKLGPRKMRSRPITEAEYSRLVEVANSSGRSHLVPVLEFCYWGGLRIGEVAKLTADPLGDFVVTLDEPPRFIIQGHAQKSRIEQQALIAPELVTILQGRWESFPKTGRLLPAVPAGPHWLSRTIAQLGRDSGIVVNDQGKTVTAHDLRRSFATRWASRVSPAVLQKLTRHADVSTVMDYYVSLDLCDLARQIDRYT